MNLIPLSYGNKKLKRNVKHQSEIGVHRKQSSNLLLRFGIPIHDYFPYNPASNLILPIALPIKLAVFLRKLLNQ
jgi:hypothetical protein